MSIAKATLLGRVGKSELFYTQSSTAILTLQVATNKKTKDQEITLWHTVKIIGKRAEALNKYIDKGTQLYIEGNIDIVQWAEKETNKTRFKNEIIALDVQLIGGSNQGENKKEPQQQNGDRAF